MAIPKPQTHHQAMTDNDWTLSPEQMLYLIQHHNAVESAFAKDDLESLRIFASSEEFTTLFDNMGFDEAYDRYEILLESGDAT